MFTVPRVLALSLASVVMCVALGFTSASSPADTATPKDLVASYATLADAILAVKQTEAHLVRAILSAGWMQARSVHDRAAATLEAGDAAGARADLEELAALVAQLGTEGDNSVAGVRKRLLEGGHHHNAEGEAQGIFDEGFVLVTKADKKTLLDASREIAAARDRAALEAAWAPVTATMARLTGS